MSLPLTSEEAIRSRLISGYDPDRARALVQQIRYLVGNEWDETYALVSSKEKLPHFGDLVSGPLIEGRSRQILNNLFIDMARVRYAEIEPEFPQVGLPVVAEGRKQFWLSRARGDGLPSHENWTDQLDSAYFEGNALGCGFVQLGLVNNPATNRTRIGLRHVPALQVLWDPYSRYVSRARWVAIAHYWSPEAAIRRFGNAVRDAITTVRTASDQTREIIRILDYYDLGDEDHAPTHAMILGDLDGACLVRNPNVFELLPIADYTHLHVPGMKYPAGRVVMQMATQERINRIEQFMDEAIQQPPFTVLDNSLIDERDLARLASGELLAYVRMNSKPGDTTRPPYYQVPGAMISGYVGERYSMLVNQLNADSGITDYDRGNLSVHQRTATEISILNQRVGAQGTWPLRQMARFMRQVVTVGCQIAARFDDDFCPIDVFGVNLTINQDVSTAELFEEPSRVVISDEAILETDSHAKRDRKLRSLERLLPLATAGAIRLDALTREMLKAHGIASPDEWLPATPASQGAY